MRRLAREQVDRNVNLIKAVMEKRGRRIVDSFNVDDIVRISIPKVDRIKLGMKYLPCKVVSVVGGRYQIGCASGVLNVWYNAADMERVNIEIPELETVPEVTVSLTEAVRGVELTRSGSVNNCRCKSTCSIKRCGCRRINIRYNPQCHPANRQCSNH